MILSDTDILNELASGDLVVEPLEDIDTQVQPASIDVRLGSEFTVFNQTNIPYIDPRSEKDIAAYTRDIEIDKGDNLIIHPGDFILGTTVERVEIPHHLVASVEGRSSLGRLAIIVHATAGWIDSGFKGRITLEITNLGVAPVALWPGMRIGQIVIQELKSECTRAYGEDRDSKYQNQTGPKASKIETDKELTK